MPDVIERTLLRCGRTVPTWLYKSLLAHVMKRAGLITCGKSADINTGLAYVASRHLLESSWLSSSRGNSSRSDSPATEKKSLSGTGWHRNPTPGHPLWIFHDSWVARFFLFIFFQY